MSVSDEEDDAAGLPNREDDADRSVVRECYWVLCGQFEESDDDEDALKTALIAIAIATGLLAFTAATTALLASVRNWPVSLLLSVLGVATLVFAWFVGLHRLDEVVLNTG